MSEYIPNQPVSFGPDINIYPPIGCEVGRHYYAPVNRGDLTTFQLPNICPPDWGSQMIANGDFAGGLGGWDQGDGNGSDNSWEIASGKAHAIPESKILNQPLPIEAFQKYKLNVDLTLGAGCTLVVVLYRDPYTEGSTDYIRVAEITTTGSQTVEFTTDGDYVRIGFILEGDCDDSEIDNLELYQADYDCLEICIKDLEGNTIESVTDIEYYGEKIVVTVDWEALDIDNGCYYICICNDNDVVFADNLFTLGDYGSFEDDSTGISSDETAERSTALAYKGLYSYKVAWDSAVPSRLMRPASDITLKKNTNYRLSARVYADAPYNSGSPSNALIQWNLQGFTGAITNSSNTLDPDISSNMEAWHEVYIDFTTDTDNVGSPEIKLTGSEWPLLYPSGIDFYIDNVLLYEVSEYSSCSQGFNLSDSHRGTLLLQYTNDNDAFGFIYPTDFYFYMRVPGGLQHPRYPEELKTFRTTDGIGSVAFAESTKVEVLAVNSVPEYTHDALRLAVLHDTLLIEGIDYVKIPGEYRPSWDKGAYIAPVEIEVEKSLQNTRNAKC